MTLEDKIAFLQAKGLHNICFRNAGVGCLFYEGPYDDNGFPPRETWENHLKLYNYYPTIVDAVDAECQRLEGDGQ